MASDDSNFYGKATLNAEDAESWTDSTSGDPDTVAGLQTRVNAFNVDAWIRQQQANPGRPQPRPAVLQDTSHLHNPYEGVSYAWQLRETVDDFLARLPPRTTDRDEQVPWIFICNPYIPRVERGACGSQVSQGNEDEAPQEEGSRLPLVLMGAKERLDLVTSFVEKANKMPRAASTVEREINKERKQAAEDILNLAHAGKVRPGKWMLFCSASEVDEVWGVVAKATANNELGIAAKVAPRPPIEDPRKDRLICVYTADFKDKADVGRVVQKLRELRLVEARGRPIYYKPDVYTYIGIATGNPWGLRPSIYSSGDAFS